MLVSIIIPTYNRKKLLEEAIASVLSQNFRDFELIIVDDGSTLDYQIKRLSNDKRIKYYCCPHRGVSSARNFGVKVAKGKYIAFLDSDDLWNKKKLKKQFTFLKRNPELKACYTNETWIRSGEHLNPLKKHEKHHGWIFEKCLPLCIISCSSILIEKELFNNLGGFDDSLPVCEDYDLWLRLSLKHPIAYLDDKLITKRGGHPDQLSKKYWGMDRFRIKALEKLLSFKLTNEQRNLVLEELKKKCEILKNGSWKRKRFLQGLVYANKRLRYSLMSSFVK
jgi:glycosyltransferase involved in cell wall biosynthesis